MVFSQTIIKTPSILKVVEINHLKPEPDLNGETTGGNLGSSQEPQPMASSFSEVRGTPTVFLKTEPIFEDTMLNESECEFFQGLEQWCLDPAKEEPVQTDSLKNREDHYQYTDTPHTTFSPSGWDGIDTNSPGQAGFYTSPSNPLSPHVVDGFIFPENKLMYNTDIENKQPHLQEPIWDIPNLPVLIGDLAPEEIIDLDSGKATEPVSHYNTNNPHDNTYTTMPNAHKMLLTDEEDSFDMKMNTVTLKEVENNNVIAEYILSEPEKGGVLERSHHSSGLSLNLASASWTADAISTPEVLNYVDQLEREKYILPVTRPTQQSTLAENQLVTALSCTKKSTTGVDYYPSTPKSGSVIESDIEDNKPLSRKRRRDSEDSDETYIPEIEHRQRKTSRKRPAIALKDMIHALEESRQLPKARRGRPPKKERRESTVSSVGSIDDSISSVSTSDKYRELRNKNNEASKRSRMNRKLKELQMEQLVIELEERNKKLKVKADILEDMTKKLKDALMTAILQK